MITGGSLDLSLIKFEYEHETGKYTTVTLDCNDTVYCCSSATWMELAGTRESKSGGV